MRLLITGGAGFIGSNFIRYILEKYPEYEVVNLDKLTYSANLENLKDVENDSRYRFVEGDICDEEVLEGVLEGCDAVVHFAAETHVDRSITNDEIFLKTNILGTRMLFEKARNRGVRRIIHISTDEVYGSIEDGSFTEESPVSPNSPYAASKAAADLFAKAYYATYKLPVIITRSSNNFGPYQFPEKLIPLFITNLLEDKKVPVYGNGLNVRDWIYVEDNCRGIDFVLHKGEVGEVYNIGGGVEKTNLELTEFILRRLGKDKEMMEFVKDRPGHDQRYSLDTGKMRQLGWAASYSFEEAIEKTVAWYIENEAWWRGIKERLGRDGYHWLSAGNSKSECRAGL